jgi:UDPglucose 6-dehydrogenase
MELTIIGTGYVGLVTGASLSEMGNKVYCVDIDNGKIEKLKKGIIPIYEPGLEELVSKNINNNLFFTTNLNTGLKNSSICFIAVGTPMGEDGSANLQYVLAAAKEIGQTVSNDIIVVNKSTVPVGTADKIKEIIIKELEIRDMNYKIHVVSNPEFLKEGAAVADFMRPNRVVLGSDDDDEVLQTMKDLYNPFTINHERFITMDVRSAEMTKYAANAMLATRISFMNEIANICEKVGADINHVREGIGSDSRIGYNFLYAGCGYGGSCFPKDIKALIKTADDHGYNSIILKGVESVNNQQKVSLVNKIIKRFGNDLSGYTFAVWGLSFKPETDDMREAASVVIINKLIKLGAKINSYDPKSINIAKKYYFKDNPNIKYSNNKYDILDNADAMILVTEWKEFRSPDFEEIKEKLKNNIIFDGRNQYNKDMLRKMGFEYYQIGI